MKTRKRKYTTTILATALLFSLGGCVKDELHDTPHPDKGVVTVSIDLPQGASGEDYTVEIDGTTADGKERHSSPVWSGQTARYAPSPTSSIPCRTISIRARSG